MPNLLKSTHFFFGDLCPNHQECLDLSISSDPTETLGVEQKVAWGLVINGHNLIPVLALYKKVPKPCQFGEPTMPAIDKYLSAVQKNEASDLHLNDIHLNTGSAPIFRVHGMMRPPTSHALEAEEICNMLYGIMTNTARKT